MLQANEINRVQQSAIRRNPVRVICSGVRNFFTTLKEIDAKFRLLA